jgi:creatinine amidohydrolase
VANPDFRIVSLDAWWNTLSSLLPAGFFEVWNGLGHGGEGEMSIGLALFPELCKYENAVGVVPDLPPYVDVKWLFSELTGCGASGNPTKGSREKGLKMREVLVNTIVGVLKKLDECDWDYRSQ